MVKPYRKGLHDLGDGVYAYLQPDGSWGWSNAGLIVDGEQSLLVDNLFDLKLTQAMLDEMRAAAPAAASFDYLVNTHANGDHCWGNELVAGAEIIASRAGAEEMAEVPPPISRVGVLSTAWSRRTRIGSRGCPASTCSGGPRCSRI